MTNTIEWNWTRYSTGTDYEDDAESVSVEPPTYDYNILEFTPSTPEGPETPTLLDAEVKDDAKQISLSFLKEGNPYKTYIPIMRKIKYKVYLPGDDEPIYCSTVNSVSACLKANGIDKSMWQVYRFMKRTDTDGVIDASGARVLPVT